MGVGGERAARDSNVISSSSHWEPGLFAQEENFGPAVLTGACRAADFLFPCQLPPSVMGWGGRNGFLTPETGGLRVPLGPSTLERLPVEVGKTLGFRICGSEWFLLTCFVCGSFTYVHSAPQPETL